MEPAMLAVLFEAHPEPGQFDSYRDYAAALQCTVGGGEPAERNEYRSATRDGWLMSLAVWAGKTVQTGRAARTEHPGSRGEALGSLFDYRLRTGEVAFDTRAAPSPHTPQPDSAGEEGSAVTVLSMAGQEACHALDNPRQCAERLGLGSTNQGLAAWDLFESLDQPGEAVILLSWRSQQAARAFEREHELPAGTRLQRVHVSSDRRATGTPSSAAQRHLTLQPLHGQTADDGERERLRLLADAGATVGATLDLVSTAQALADVLVPRLADAATVDVLDDVVRGEACPLARRTLRRVASAMALKSGSALDGQSRSTPRCPPLPSTNTPLQGPALSMSPTGGMFTEIFGHDALNSRYIRDLAVHSVTVVPLSARAAGLGLLTVYRWREPHGLLQEGDLDLLQELARRAATALENAQTYACERDTAVALRRATLPLSVPRTPALEVRHGFDPACADGRWYDVIRLPGARTALVVGDSTALGASAAVAAVRLRSAIRALAALETPPQELLTRLNDLAVDLAPCPPDDQERLRSTCLYLVYDPVRPDVTFASAGHCPPVVASPGSGPHALHEVQGPGLGEPGAKYSEVRLSVEPDTLLALAALPEPGDPSAALQAALEAPGLELDARFQAAAHALAPSWPAAAPLLIARTSLLGPDQTASWALASDIAIVATARALVDRQLDAWGIGKDIKFVTVLIVSELVTNAVRHASAPIMLRLIRRETLFCEVSDGSSVAPYLQHAQPSDESGRGLLIVAETVLRWGVRHDLTGKTIWTEQELSHDGPSGLRAP
ncbi:ATP-binding SpoIIE family protein phosphatase [Streptomyces mirabilis]|uniref:ATP-binding SpoIIE family protein phosphatase n=1 Tax=Streptomyces mirabilis TaxID=68239 RepID=UPI002254FC59|nr:SpoIIE family protein phosphatase [Streptomyces mirabilis]MCX4419257.1 SpoIIE family protein phosphatase [Streptomyces mirabilis]